MLGAQELVLILLIVVMVFGAKRIPEIMSGLGKGIRSFKQAIDGDDALTDKQPATSDSPHSSDHSNAPKPTDRDGTGGS